MTKDEIRNRLFSLADEDYKAFHSKLIPTVNSDKIIGVRTPALRSFANEVYKSGDFQSFLCDLPHKYYDEDNLHAFLIEKIKDFNECIKLTNEFLPYMDNWATCDMFSPKTFKKEKAKLYGQALQWIKSDKTYVVRYGIGCLMKYYLDDDFSLEHLKIVCEIKSDEYYINMMIAWYFATALAKQYDSTIVYIVDRRLPIWIHNKTIQKAIESSRISGDRKAYLRTLRWKDGY